jgi:TRAP-type C4-dicarboxylate transport system permease large subunit
MDSAIDPMTSRSHESLAASLGALCLALIAAGLVLWGDWTPWEAMVIVVAAALFLVVFGLASLMLLAGNHSNRHQLWNIFVHTVKTDLQPFVDLWKRWRGRHR